MSCHSTPFLWCLPKETVSSRQRKALFYPGGSTIRVSAAASVVFTHLRPTWGGGWWLSERLPSPGANGICYDRFAQSVDLAGVTVVIRFRLAPKARFFGAPPRFFAQEQRNGVERAGPARSIARGTAHTQKPPPKPGGGLFITQGACRRLSMPWRWNSARARRGSARWHCSRCPRRGTRSRSA